MSFIHLKKVQPVSPPRFVSPRKRVAYHDPAIQGLVTQAFNGLLPQIINYADGNAEFFVPSGEVADLQTVKELGQSDLIKGRHALQKIAGDLSHPEGVRAILKNFKLPHPQHCPELYRVNHSVSGGKKLSILWGFEPTGKNFVPLDDILTLLWPDSFSADNFPAENEEPQQEATRTPNNKVIIAAAAAAVAIALITTFFLSRSSSDQTDPEPVSVSKPEPTIEAPASSPPPPAPVAQTALPEVAKLDHMLEAVGNEHVPKSFMIEPSVASMLQKTTVSR